jgi:hypothetical protein
VPPEIRTTQMIAHMGAMSGAENLETQRSPSMRPKRRTVEGRRRCAIAQNAVTAAKNMQVAVMSLVTRAPFASIVGQKAKSAAARSPPLSPYRRRPQKKTSAPVATPKRAIMRRPSLSILSRSLPIV